MSSFIMSELCELGLERSEKNPRPEKSNTHISNNLPAESGRDDNIIEKIEKCKLFFVEIIIQS